VKVRQPEDRLAFYLAINRVAPQMWEDGRRLSAERRAAGSEVTHEDVAAFLRRWGLEPTWPRLAFDVYHWIQEPIGIPATGGGYGTHNEVLHLRWEPADTGEDRTAFRKRAAAELDAYVDRVEAWRRRNEYELPPRENDRGEVETGVTRWDLLASKLVLGKTEEAIAAEFGITKQGVAKHLRRLSERLDIAPSVRQPRRRR
jgi:hypothetical protein